MSRLDAALRRARGNSSEPDSFEMASDTALDWFDPASAAPPVADMPTNAMPGDATPATDVLLSFPSAPEDDAASPAAPRDVAPETAPSIDSQHAHRLITSQLLRPVTVEQYRRIAAVLHHVQRDRGVKVVMVSSAIPGEGKTLTASNLALTLSQSYQRRVLLIDADLRRPMVHETFGLSNAVGLSNVLDAFEDVAPRFVKVMEHLTVLPA
ncbi:MAG TPA: hypothetical protein VHZ73_14060, partial [Vicinamibacterales bacterium]|nr:hypothetical protein [Vicinamibacterales bacterium]